MNYNDATGPRSSRARAVAAAAKAAAESGSDEAPAPSLTYKAMLRALVDEQNLPNRDRIAWAPSPADPWSEREEFLARIDPILDGVQTLIDRVG